MKYQFTLAQISNRGSREINEDAIYTACFNGNTGMILCDGLGGHGLGDVASGLVVDVFRDEFKKAEKTADLIPAAFDAAQQKLLAEQSDRNVPNKMKTTAVMAVADERNLRLGHIGDSRAYVFYKNKVLKRTLDHSVPQMLVLSKVISEEEIRNHPDRNLLVRVMGTRWNDKQYEIMKPLPLRKVQAVLLCSDGFWELVDEACMCRLLTDADNVQQWLDMMVKILEANGEGRDMDNYSAIAM